MLFPVRVAVGDVVVVPQYSVLVLHLAASSESYGLEGRG